MDQRAQELQLAASGDPSELLIWGNATELLRDGQHIVAHSQYDLWTDERMPIDEFVAGLGALRTLTETRLGGPL
jgi:hypothetical protein